MKLNATSILKFSARCIRAGSANTRSVRHCTIEELMEVFVEEMPDASIQKSPQLIRDFLNSFALFRIDDIDELKLRSFYMRQKLEYDYTSHSLATRKYQIQGFFKWLISRGIVEVSPQEFIRMGKSNVYKRKPIHIEFEQIKKILGKAKELSPGLLYPALLLVTETAAKTSDIAGLKWTHIDFKKGRVKFQGGPKIKPRDLEMSEALSPALKRIDPFSEHVFTSLDGRPVYKHSLTRELRAFQRQAGLDLDWVFRDLRHSFAVNYMKAGGQTEDLQKILGHWHPRLTEELYGAFKVHNVDLIETAAVCGTGNFSSENDNFGEL